MYVYPRRSFATLSIPVSVHRWGRVGGTGDGSTHYEAGLFGLCFICSLSQPPWPGLELFPGLSVTTRAPVVPSARTPCARTPRTLIPTRLPFQCPALCKGCRRRCSGCDAMRCSPMLWMRCDALDAMRCDALDAMRCDALDAMRCGMLRRNPS